MSAYNAGDVGSIPGLGRSPGEGNGNPLQYSFLLGSEITGLTALSPFRLSFFSTRSPLSPPYPLSSLSNSVNLFVCSGLWRTLRKLITGWICLSPFDSPFILLATSVSFLPLLFSVVQTVESTQGSDYCLACSLLF